MGTDRENPAELHTFARKFREAREARSLTQADLCRQLDMDKSYFSDIERAVANPSIQVMAKMARAVGYELCDLLCTTGAHETKPLQSRR